MITYEIDDFVVEFDMGMAGMTSNLEKMINIVRTDPVLCCLAIGALFVALFLLGMDVGATLHDVIHADHA